MNAGRLFLGIVAGAAAGALLGVLLAPDKGTETRRKMMDKGDRYASNLKDKFNTFLNSFKKRSTREEGEYASENEFRQNPVTNI